jgi:hypothetical protein
VKIIVEPLGIYFQQLIFGTYTATKQGKKETQELIFYSLMVCKQNICDFKYFALFFFHI